MNSTIIGPVEKVTLNKKDILARIDTGASRSSIDSRLASELKLGPIKKTKFVRSAHGSSVRPVVEAEMMIAHKKVRTELTIADRWHMKYKLLIGRDVLKNGVLIDVTKNEGSIN